MGDPDLALVPVEGQLPEVVAVETLRVVGQFCRLRILKVSGRFPGQIQSILAAGTV